ncbi:cytochrome C oxidase subunit IV family protein [Stappia sp. TSB10GB4]|uniref:cytochrome C oxidase subunit IV family protein n=1 Tax=Stappia sp. TSB10GB4 TaxID=2003584 RepID=UPI0016471CCB|nr:cytochrome C oxidase subunit IV family protein [Stappia sp. TSB10GB4]
MARLHLAAVALALLAVVSLEVAGGSAPILVWAILALSIAKAWIVLTEFLGLREAPAGWRYGLIALVAALGGTIGAVFTTAHLVG